MCTGPTKETHSLTFFFNNNIIFAGRMSRLRCLKYFNPHPMPNNDLKPGISKYLSRDEMSTTKIFRACIIIWIIPKRNQKFGTAKVYASVCMCV